MFDYSTHGLSTAPADTWLTLAACRPGTGVDPEIFHYDGTGSLDLHMQDVAKAVCRTCPVTTECLIRADTHGTWAGLTAPERKARAEHGRKERYAAECLRCGDHKVMHGRGLCGKCRHILVGQGRLDEYPPLRGDARLKDACPRGHRYNVRADGGRECFTCKGLRSKARVERLAMS